MKSSTIRFGIVIIILIILAGVAWSQFSEHSYILPVQRGDSIESWNFQGARTGSRELEKQARDEIARQEALLGGDQNFVAGESTDYILYVGIAQQYDWLGDGEKEREYLEKALAIDSDQTGLAWHNLGALFARLGAYNTARVAYDRAVEAQPIVTVYHLARIQFLMNHFASDEVTVDAAITDAEAQFNDPSVLQLKAQWLEMSNRVEGAIQALESMRVLMPADAQSTVDSEIERLRNL